LSGLTIYKASAGSGKTFTITREYIYLLFRDPDNYRHILGVTFTNKATAEMKSRIIAELDKLSKGDKSAYAEGLMNTYSLNPSALKQRASFILSKILHDFSHFTILTIDSFFQRVIRAFAREIGFYQGFDMELDQELILSKAVDLMIFELDSKPDLLNWLVSFAGEKVVEGNSWNINRDIEKLGREIFKENFKEFGDQLIDKITNKELLNDFNRELYKIKTGFEKNLKDKGKEAVDILKKNGIENDDLKGKSRSIGTFFGKIAGSEKFDDWKITATQRNHLNDVNEWITGSSSKKNIIENAFNAGLNKILGEIIDIHDNNFRIYLSVLAVQKHLYVLGVLADLLLQIRDYTSDRNLFLISDTAEFLKKLIQGSDTPFVFERIGSFIHHFMIDEFQDTSSLQWFNLRPLMTNSLAENNANWVVGDVKQSIYRWRNSDWTILSEKIFSDLDVFKINVETLTYNWRSSFNIVSFNNTFFQNAIQILSKEVNTPDENLKGADFDDCEAMLQKAYSDFIQIVPEHKNINAGLVDIGIIPKSEDKTIKFEDQALKKLKVIIENLQDNHYSLKDIAILVREKGEGEKVSEYLLKLRNNQLKSLYRYDILSNDSLLLKNSEAVKWIISVITYVIYPSDPLNKAFLVYQYEKILFPDDKNDIHLDNIFRDQRSAELPDRLHHFFQQELLNQYSVYELCDKVISYFRLVELKSELPFLQAFQDMLHGYSLKEPVDLSSFLRWWEEKQDKFVISMPDHQDAIRLMTFHSAKGLEFKVVIMPFADWDFMKTGWNSNIIWCKTDMEPFNKFELLPVNLSMGLQNTIFSHDYFHEKTLSLVDNLNLLYVAFTRAIEALYVLVPESSKESIDNVGNLIVKALKYQVVDASRVSYPAIDITQHWSESEKSFIYGKLPVSEGKDVTTEVISIEEIAYTIRPVTDVVKQVIPTIGYFTPEGETLHSRIDRGKIMHEVFQRIKTIEDIDDALKVLLLEGKISEVDIALLKNDIKELISNAKVQSWFAPGWQVRTEAGILLKDGSLPRPDRVLIKGEKAVVIDYKFGESEHPSHQWQVQKYMQHLYQMNYKNVEGFLWYVTIKKIVPVQLASVQGTLF
jgi:ATP-dependent helicase/nuclease subunit A